MACKQGLQSHALATNTGPFQKHLQDNHELARVCKDNTVACFSVNPLHGLVHGTVGPS